MRPRTPQDTPGPEPGYPTLPDLARRGFLVAAGTVAAGGLLLGPRRARGESGRPEERQVALRLTQRYVFRHGNQRLDRVTAQTADAGLIDFLLATAEAAGLEKALLAVLDAHSCEDLGDGKRLAAMQVKIGQAVARRYQERTRRRAAPPTITIFVGLPVANCRGKCLPPVPYCRPPRP